MSNQSENLEIANKLNKINSELKEISKWLIKREMTPGEEVKHIMSQVDIDTIIRLIQLIEDRMRVNSV